jgi:hypothetical protein
LLDLCGEALHALIESNDAAIERRKIIWDHGVAEAERQRDKELLAVQSGADERATAILRRARKLRATTPAGVYAKALIVRTSKTGAAEFAMSLAEDMIACEGLRQSLWPADPVEAQP